MAKEEKAKTAPAKEEKAKTAVDPLAEYRELNKGIDIFSKACSLTLKLPTSPERLFIAKAKLVKATSRLGEGPCMVEKKFAMPNGDIAIKGDTFDPVQERMDPIYYRSLLKGKFFSTSDRSMYNKLIQASEKTK